MFVIGLIFLGISVCTLTAAPDSASTPVPISLDLSTPTAVAPSATPSPTLPPTATATVSPSPTASPTHTSSPRATSTRSEYPLPTQGGASKDPYPLPSPSATAVPNTPTRTVTPTARPTNTPTVTRAPSTPLPVPASGEPMNTDEAKMFAVLNAERVKAGLKPLVVDVAFQAVAHARAQDMAARNYYSHNDPVTGQRLAKVMLERLGVTVPAGENFYVAWGGDGLNKAMAWLMSDPIHRDNILGPRWTVGGVGAVPKGNTLIMVQVFGAR